VVDDLNSNDVGRVHEAVGGGDVLAGRGRVARRVIVREHDLYGTTQDGGPKNVVRAHNAREI
jgi:hypothetical protein